MSQKFNLHTQKGAIFDFGLNEQAPGEGQGAEFAQAVRIRLSDGEVDELESTRGTFTREHGELGLRLLVGPEGGRQYDQYVGVSDLEDGQRLRLI